MLIPSLSNKLLSISQIIVDIHCVALTYPTIYLLQDIFTEEIIGNSMRREDLYYMDEFNSSRADMMQSIDNVKKQEIWL